MMKTIHPLFSYHLSTKWKKEAGAYSGGGGRLFLILTDRRGAYSKGALI